MNSTESTVFALLLNLRGLTWNVLARRCENYSYPTIITVSSLKLILKSLTNKTSEYNKHLLSVG